MSRTSILTKRQVTRIVNQGARTPSDRTGWLQGVQRDPPLLPQLPDRNARKDQLRSDVEFLNRVFGSDPEPLLLLVQNLRRASKISSNRRSLGALQEICSRRIWAKKGLVKQEVTLERAVLSDDTVSFAFMASAVDAGHGVCHLTVKRARDGEQALSVRGSNGTGFLLGKRHILTNWHVLASRSEGEPAPSTTELARQAASIVARFDYDHPDSQPLQIKGVRWVAGDSSLDYALIELEQALDRTAVRIRSQPLLSTGQTHAANVIQHPWGEPKRYAIRNNLVHRATVDEIQYFSDTEQGSSGSPVFDDSWQLIALHRGNKRVAATVQGQQVSWLNFGTPIHRVLQHLKTNSTLWDAVKNGVSAP